MLTEHKNSPSQQDLCQQLMQQPLNYVVEDVDARYQAYLTRLHFRNLQRTVLERHNKERRRKERLEKGFKLYFNLPSTEDIRNGLKQTPALPFSSSPEENVGERRRWNVGRHNSAAMLRAKSAPSLKKMNKLSKWGEVVLPKLGASDSSRHNHRIAEVDKNTQSRQSSGQCTRLMSFSQQTMSLPKKIALQLTVTIDVLTNWGDPQTVGLSGVQLFTVSPVSQELTPDLQQAGHDFVGCSQASRNNLISSPFDTTIPAFMWSTKKENLPCTLKFSFCLLSDTFMFTLGELEFVLCLWNYNDPKKLECGIHDFIISVFHQSKTIMMYKGVCNCGDGRHPSGSATKVRFSISEGSENFKSCNIDSLQHEQRPNALGTSDNVESDEEGNAEKNPSANLSEGCISTMHQNMRSQGKTRFLSNVCDTLLKYNIGSECQKNELEASWTSLEFFNHFHAGRLDSQQLHSRLDLAKPTSSPTLLGSSQDNALLTSDDEDELMTFMPDLGICDTDCAVDTVPATSEHQVLGNNLILSGRSSRLFEIPSLPWGTRMVVDIVNTWGDPYYVGLSGLEIFTKDGKDISRYCRISADPPDINVLPGYTNDPRVVGNLIDGVNWTRDDVHMWLTPFSPGAHHLIHLSLPDWTQPLALVRVWNYNKSRVHTSRGARELIIYLDAQVIFHGEVRQASGGLESSDPNEFCETILFTTDDDILEVVAQNDFLFAMHAQHSGPNELVCENAEEVQMEAGSAKSTRCLVECESTTELATNLACLKLQPDEEPLCSSWLELKLLDTWQSDADRIGLTGIELLDQDGSSVKITGIKVHSSVSIEADVLGRLLDGENRTTDTEHMWSVPFTRQSPPTLLIQFVFPTGSPPKRIHIWNYNDRRQSGEYGVRLLELMGDLTFVNPVQLMMRRSPGHSEYPYGQTFWLKNDNHLMSSLLPNPYSADRKPGFGSVFLFEIYSTWQDQFYVGLDGLEMIGSIGEIIQIPPDAVSACPSSVRLMGISMPHCHSDIRTADKLVDGIVSGPSMCQHSWLAPVLPDQINKIYVVFDAPVQVAGIRLWNYTRTPDRGVRDFAVLVDEDLVFRGCLPKVSERLASFPADTGSYHIVVFNFDVLRGLGEDSQRFLQPVGKSDKTSGLIEADCTISGESRNKLFSRPRLYNRLRSARVNQTLRPFTCVSETRPCR